MDRLLLIHESSLKPLVDNYKFEVKGIDMCAQNLLKHDADLLDKVAERFIEKYDLKYGQSEKFREMLNDIIAEMKAEVNNDIP